MTTIGCRPHSRRAETVLLATALCGALVACVGSGEGVPDAASSSGVPRTFDEIQTMIFDPLCAASCHKGGAAPKGLALEAGQSLRNLVGVASQEVPELLRVAPGRPEESYLIVKVVQFDARRVQLRMPRNGPPWLTNGQVRALMRWITAGAKNNWIDEDDDDDGGVVSPDDAGISDASVADAGISDAGISDALADNDAL